MPIDSCTCYLRIFQWPLYKLLFPFSIVGTRLYLSLTLSRNRLTTYNAVSRVKSFPASVVQLLHNAPSPVRARCIARSVLNAWVMDYSATLLQLPEHVEVAAQNGMIKQSSDWEIGIRYTL